MAGSAQPVPASVQWTDGLGAAIMYATTGRFDNWMPMQEDIGARTVNVGQGLTFLFKYRTDYTATFEMSSMSPASLSLAQRLKVWAESGGQFTVNTQDRQLNSYICVLKPKAQISWTFDRTNLVYTIAIAAKNTLTGVMACLYSSFLGTGFTIVVTPNPISLGQNVGQTLPLTAQVLDPAGNPVSPAPTVAWSSTNPAVATVDQSGNVTAVATGSCNIIATVGSTSIAVPCAVNISQSPQSITLSPTSLAFTATTYTGTPSINPATGRAQSGVPTQTVTATVLNGSGSSVAIIPGMITWTTTGGGVSVSDNGAGVLTLTAIAGGASGTITATVQGASGPVSQSINYSTVAEVPAVLLPSTYTLNLQSVGANATISVQTIGQYGSVIP